MIQRAFQHRSGRVIALSRMLLAVLFTLAVYGGSTQPERFSEAAKLLLTGFAAISIALLSLTWNNWWLEARLAAPAHVADLVIFTVLVALTSGYASPFFAIFVFLVLSAAIRWGWREALATTLLVLISYLAAGLFDTSEVGSSVFDGQRLMLRATNLVILSLMIIWFGVNQFGMRPIGAPLLLTDALDPPVRPSLEHVESVLGAGRTVFAWSESEEPWLHVATLQHGRFEEERLGPDVFPHVVAEDLEHRAFIYDSASRKLLLRSGRRRNALTRRTAVDDRFVGRFGVKSGIVIPMRTDAFQGHIFATEVPGLCSDDLDISAQLGTDISLAFERVALLAASREAAATRARLVLARDLHDSLVQFQAGLALKLQGIKIAAEEGVPVAGEIDELRQQLAQEQRDLRTLISALRDPSYSAEGIDLGNRITAICKRLERQWGISCHVEMTPGTVRVRPQLQHDVDQIIREAVANAVRHGGAGKIWINVTFTEGKLSLVVRDDGAGFPIKGEFGDQELWERRLGPRSLQERIRSLGGLLTLATNEQGSRLAIALPYAGAAA